MTRFRAIDGLVADGLRLQGIAIHYDEIAGPPRLPFQEVVRAGAFGDLDRANVRLDVQHRRDQVIARTGSGLVLIDSPSELRFVADLPNSPAARATVKDVKEGRLRGSSIEYEPIAEHTANGVLNVTRAELVGIGAVAVPAYVGSSIQARAEIRQAGHSLEGSFFYDQDTIVSDRQASVRKSRISPGAFRFALADDTREISILLGRDYSQPLGSKLGGSVTFENTAQALTFRIEQLPSTSYVADFRAGLATNAASFGVAPMYRLPPPDVVPNAVRTIPEVGNAEVLIEVIDEAILTGLAIVSRAPRGNPGSVELRSARRPTLWPYL